MLEFTLSWTCGVGESGTGGHEFARAWSDVEACLAKIEGGQGSVTLEVCDRDVGPLVLQVLADSDAYLLTLGVDDGVDYSVRSYSGDHESEEMVNILGNYWSRKLICNNFDVVRYAFREFLSSGDVSEEILK